MTNHTKQKATPAELQELWAGTLKGMQRAMSRKKVSAELLHIVRLFLTDANAFTPDKSSLSTCRQIVRLQRLYVEGLEAALKAESPPGGIFKETRIYVASVSRAFGDDIPEAMTAPLPAGLPFH